MCKAVLLWLVTALILLTPEGGDKEKGASPRSRAFGWNQSKDLFRVSHLMDLTHI